MAFALDEQPRALQDLVRRVARERIAPRANAIDRGAEYPHDMFELLRALGLFAVPFGAQYGGTGSMLCACVVIEELARVCYNTAYILVVQWTPIGAILAAGTPEQKQRYLEDLASGRKRAAIAVTEPQSGSDVAGMRTRARCVDGGYRINGAKIWCTGAPIADFIFVAARTGEGEGRGSINLFALERDAPGLRIGRKEDKMGARGIPSCPLFLDEVFVPAQDRLGEEGKGFKAVMETFNVARPIHGARGVGLAQGAIDHALDFVRSRHAFGQCVGDFQGVRWMLADMAMQTEAARNLVYRAAAMVDAGASGQTLAPISAMAKCFATDCAMKVTTDAVQLFGAAGISSEYPINRYMRDAKVLQIVEGTNQIQRNIVANSLLGRPARS
ncbi:MAG: acyl-CoA dehydrogenase family protein [Burkholderiales bacterium]|nr:acyl-CoA dehydrogenase family protein [Burkholderiales bacterium]